MVGVFAGGHKIVRRFEKTIVENDEAAFFVFVTFDELLPRDGVAVFKADTVEPDRRFVFSVEHAEPRPVIADGLMNLDRNVHEAE